MSASPNLGIVHDWIAPYGGAEQQLVQMAQLYPDADIYTLFDFRGDDHQVELGQTKLHTSALDKWPLVEKYYQSLLLLAIREVEKFDLVDHDVVFSISSALAKGAITHAGQSHLAYVNSPARYAWDLHAEYLDLLGGHFAPLKRLIAHEMFHRFRKWDMRTPQSIDLFLANSKYIAQRIWKTYRRRSYVLYPPVDVTEFQLNEAGRDEFYVCASRLVPYKRTDLIVQAFNQLPDRKLIVVGAGPELAKIKALAGPNIEVVGRQPSAQMVETFQKARALVFAAQEDFGIVPVEAQACGTPVIALSHGGTAETIRPLGLVDRPTGVHFAKQTIDDLIEAIRKFEAGEHEFDPANCRRNAMRFSNERFKAEVAALVARANDRNFREENILEDNEFSKQFGDFLDTAGETGNCHFKG